MRKAITTYVFPTLACGLVLAMAAGCGKKDKKDDSGPAPAVDTSVTETTVDGGNLRVKYKSTDPNAKFKCQLEAEGQTAEWQDCPADGATLAVQPGVRYVFRVKAVGASGLEDAEPYSYAFTAGSTPGGDGTDGSGTLQTLILNKDEVGETYDKSTLTLEFGVNGGPSAEDVRYECKRENETVFRRCPSGDRYEFLDLRDGYSYGLAVRAVLRQGGAVAQEEGVSFRVELTNIDITGADQLQAKTGTAQMQFALEGADRFSCTIDQEQPSDCTQGLQVRLNSLSEGNHSLVIQAMRADQSILASETLSFCAISCGGTDGGPVQTLNPIFMLGSHYTVNVPQGMHVQQYSSNVNPNGALDFYRVSVDSDPYAIGIDRCVGEWDMITSALSPRGDSYDYCHSTRPQVVQNFLMERRFANNHLQIGTDPDVIDQNPNAQQVILFNMFTQYAESFHTQSRFATLCQFGLDGFTGLNAIRRSDYPIALANGFFDIEWKHANFWTCDVWLSGAGNGGWGQPQLWKIGAFYIADRNQPLPDLTCGACGYAGTKNLLEVVYMSRANVGPDALFAQAAQAMMLRTMDLRSARP